MTGRRSPHRAACGNCQPELITPAAQEQIDKFRDFLRSAGKPDGHTLSRLEHRPDLIRFALGLDEDGHNQ